MGTHILLRANRGAFQHTVGRGDDSMLHDVLISAPNPPPFRKTIGTPCANGAAVAGAITMAKGFGGGSNIHGHCPSENRHNDRHRAAAPPRELL